MSTSRVDHLSAMPSPDGVRTFRGDRIKANWMNRTWDDWSDAKANIFVDESAALLPMVRQRIQLEWSYHPVREQKTAGFHWLDYAEEFEKVAYHYRLLAAPREEAALYAVLFTSHGWGQHLLAL